MHEMQKCLIKQIILSLILGLLIGLTTKLIESNSYLSVFSHLYDVVCGKLGVWVFIATLLSVNSRSAKMAALSVVLFFISMLVSYYLYTILLLHFIPIKQIVFWSICAFLTPFCGYIIWNSRYKENFFSNFCAALPISVLMTEGWGLHQFYYLTYFFEYSLVILFVLYALFTISLILMIPVNKKRCIPIAFISFIISIIMIKTNILSFLFGGLNTYL